MSAFRRCRNRDNNEAEKYVVVLLELCKDQTSHTKLPLRTGTESKRGQRNSVDVPQGQLPERNLLFFLFLLPNEAKVCSYKAY